MSVSPDKIKKSPSRPGAAAPDGAPYLTSNFKIWIVGFIFFLVFFHLFNALIMPRTNIVSEKITLGIVLALMAYLWVQEVRDRHRLELMNLELVRAQRKLQDAQVDAIASLIRMEEAGDPHLHGHSQRVMKLSMAIAAAAGLVPARQGILKRAALLHDLGKSVIPDVIRHKQPPLSDEEREILEKHPVISADILEPLRFLEWERQAILHHHERPDGRGYPDGLKGEDIPIEARIIAVADTFEALNTGRLCRESCSKEFICEELRKLSGTQLDSRMVLRLFEVLQGNPGFWDRTEEAA